MNESHGWSIVVPAGWEVVAENDAGMMAARGQDVFAEVLVLPARGLTLEQLEAHKVDELRSGWGGLDDLESDLVQLPAGDAVRVTLESTDPDSGFQTIFRAYVIEHGDSQYVISARASDDREKVLAAADALAESFAILD